MAPDPDSSPEVDLHNSPVAADADEIANLDTILDRIREKTPALPYIVSVPSGIPYKSAKTQYDFRESRWTPEEKHLEYSSYLYRNTVSDGSILHLEAQGIPEDVSVQNTPRPESRSVTDPNTPGTPSLGSKKKVSLADYKKRTKDKTSTPVQSGDKTFAVESHLKLSSESGASRSTKADSTNQGNSLATSLIDSPRPSSEATLPKAAGRSLDTASPRLEKGHSSPIGKQSSQASSAPPQTKPPKDMAPSQPTTVPREQGGKSDHHAAAASSSPEDLRSMAAIRGKADDIPLIQVDTIESPLPDRLSPITSLEDLSGPVDSKDSTTFSNSLEKPFPAIDIYLDLPTDAAFQTARKSRQDAAKSPPKADQAKSAKMGDKRMANGLQDKSARKGDESRKSTVEDRPAAETSITKGRNISASATKAPEKRRREDADSETDSTAKRRKVNEVPRPNAPSSPRPTAAPPKSKLLSTPSKGLKRKAEGTPEAATPQRAPRTPPGGASKIAASPARRWKAELSRLEGIGKALKRQSQAKPDKEADRAVKERAVKLATVQGIESALCYVTAFCANDQIKPTHQSWRSLSPLLDELIQRTDGHSHLQGLCYLIRASCCSRSVSILNKVKLGDMQDAEKLKEHLIAVQTYVQRADEFAREANKHLTRSIMAEAYPEAYRASEAIPLATPSPMAVVRMAIAFLGEWSQRQGLDWKPLFEEGECARL